MTSKAPTVDAYIEEAPPERREALERLRAICRRTLRGYEERMAYGGPTYWRNGEVQLGFGSQKQHITVYLMKVELIDEFRQRIAAASIGKCCIRFSPKKVDFVGVEKLLRRNVQSDAKPAASAGTKAKPDRPR